ncbi:MAG TPA: ATP-binding protein [Flavisolibacter sp.]|nr:ATP-binding protein [Flavisolibacter sp.]
MVKTSLDARVALALLDNQPESIVYYIPVREPGGRVVDFSVAYCNKEAGHFTNLSPDELLGQSVSSMAGTDENMRGFLFDQILEVYHSGRQIEVQFFNPVLQKYFSVLRSKVDDGVLAIGRDKTAEIKEQEEKEKQQHLADSILDTSLNGIFACEAIRNGKGKVVDFRMQRINRAFTEMTGLKEEDVVGRNYLSIFPASKENGTFDMNCRVVDTGLSAHEEIYYEGDQLDAWYDVSLSKLGADGLLVTFFDITRQKKAFLETQQQKSLLDSILVHSANGISVTRVLRNEQGKVIDGLTILANDAAVRYTGIPRELYLTKTATEMDPGIVDSPYFQLCMKTLETGEPQFTQYFLEFTGRWLEITISRLDQDHIITVFTDVSQAREAALRQQQLMEELRKSNENLEEFTRAASHDLKEPIRKVHYFTGRLRSQLGGKLDAENNRILDRIEKAAERMRLLVDDLLDYSEVSYHRRETEAVDLNEKLNQILIDLELPIREKDAVIDIGPMPVINGYRRQLQQLFQNLLQNALKYSRPGVRPQIRIRSREVNGADSRFELPQDRLHHAFHLIEISDNGIGFEQKDAERIFLMFQRLHGNSEYSGSGVGLALARKVAENHNGFITAEGRPGEGSVFRVLLPAG